MTEKKTGIFLLHGITKSSSELIFIKESLEERGYYVETPNLPKHGLCPREYETCWRDVLQLSKDELLIGVEEAFQQFRGKVEEIIVGGNSIGANLAFYLANKFTVNGIIALGPIYRLSKGLEFILALEPKIRLFLGRNGNGVANEFVYHHLNVSAILQLVDIVKETPAYVKGLSRPTLLIFSKDDDVSSPQNAKFFINWLKGKKEIHLVEKGGHGLPDNPAILPFIDGFVKKCTEKFSAIEK